MNDDGLVFSSPTKFTWRQRLVLAIVPPIAAAIVRTLYATCRKTVLGREYLDAVLATGPAITGFWHESQALSACLKIGAPICTLSSYSFDGELGVRSVRWLGIRAVRGSSSRGAMKGLRQMERAIAAGYTMGLALDGPRGPRRVPKPGIAMLAASSQRPALPHVAVVTRCWRLRSWDRMLIPKPFAHVILAFGPALDPPREVDEDSMEEFRIRFESALGALQSQIERDYAIDPQLGSRG